MFGSFVYPCFISNYRGKRLGLSFAVKLLKRTRSDYRILSIDIIFNLLIAQNVVRGQSEQIIPVLVTTRRPVKQIVILDFWIFSFLKPYF
jgi:hypothetical protein